MRFHVGIDDATALGFFAQGERVRIAARGPRNIVQAGTHRAAVWGATS